MKKKLMGAVAIMVAWAIWDILFHGILLAGEYQATAQLWRTQESMNPLFTNAIALITGYIFIQIYSQFILGQSRNSALRFGMHIGILTGVGFGIASYGWMPITTVIAGGWAIANVVKFTIAGAITGYFIK